MINKTTSENPGVKGNVGVLGKIKAAILKVVDLILYII